ncbi:hypothetical protein [Bifidobacterium tibiigranuli]|uniref:Uncharacterized protein n=1 Tax=Bifidobacterium tibiigranuli TaxID=2172043 RepID=A0A5N6RXY9_9BIFI|nr:hypothetical protein [Bifidobacterium tibiigranuli]KAE8127286.1 hypothetical protein DDF78_08670 [Bifidobacterium tibiigranuli]KAE8129677.1 hypothetical protein DDE84_02450 [Bifidobacterium tibiigranuli]
MSKGKRRRSSKRDKSSGEILKSAQSSLDRAKRAWERYRERGADADLFLNEALINTVGVMYKLRNNKRRHGPEWESRFTALEATPRMQWLKHYRDGDQHGLEEGTMSSSAYIKHLGSAELWGMAPPGAVNASLGDQFGRCFWTVRRPDGREERRYFVPPQSMFSTGLVGSDENGEYEIETLLPNLIDELQSLIDSASRSL